LFLVGWARTQPGLAASRLGDGQVDDAAAAALEADARRRVQSGTFFGHIAYASVIARRPG
jgi:hypothetical protein